MRLPNGEVIMHAGKPYDPVKAHEYYMRTRKLKGRKKGRAEAAVATPHLKANPAVRARQKKELAARIQSLEKKLAQLNSLIKKKEQEAKQAARKAEADKRKSAKEAAKPDTAAEKAKKARESKKYRAKHKQELKNKAKEAASKSGGGSSKTTSTDKTKPKAGEQSVKDLKMLATKVRGQLAAAKSKLSAL